MAHYSHWRKVTIASVLFAWCQSNSIQFEWLVLVMAQRLTWLPHDWNFTSSVLNTRWENVHNEKTRPWSFCIRKTFVVWVAFEIMSQLEIAGTISTATTHWPQWALVTQQSKGDWLICICSPSCKYDENPIIDVLGCLWTLFYGSRGQWLCILYHYVWLENQKGRLLRGRVNPYKCHKLSLFLLRPPSKNDSIVELPERGPNRVEGYLDNSPLAYN